MLWNKRSVPNHTSTTEPAALQRVIDSDAASIPLSPDFGEIEISGDNALLNVRWQSLELYQDYCSDQHILKEVIIHQNRAFVVLLVMKRPDSHSIARKRQY